METIFSHSQTQVREHSDGLPVSVRGFFARLLDCRHRIMSRPFTRDGETYCVCLKCGAHRRFDIENWELLGPYYFIRPTADSE